MNVFLVDDSAIIRERLKRMLGMVEQVTVTGEEGGEQAVLDAILSLKTDVVLLGIPFAHGNGLDLLRRLRDAKPAPTVIVLTDDPYPIYRQKCLEAKADFVFIKSTDFNQVIPVLNQLIQQARDNGESSAQVTA